MMKHRVWKRWIPAAILMLAVFARGAEDEKSVEARQAALRAERVAVMAEMKELATKNAQLREKETGMRKELAAKQRAGTMGQVPKDLDEETTELVRRIEETQALLKSLKEQFAERVREHPETVADKAYAEGLHVERQALRNERLEMQQRQMTLMGRIKQIDKALAELAAEMAAAATAEE